MMYITEGMGKNFKFLAILFCIFGAFAAFGIGNMVQANSVAIGVTQQFGIFPWITGIFLFIAIGLVTLGELKPITKVAEFVAPFMAALYFLGAFILIIMNIGRLPTAVGLIFEYTFTGKAVAGGTIGAGIMMVMRYGLARSIFSNDSYII